MLKKKYVFINILIAILSLIIQYNGNCKIKSINATPMLPLGFIIVISMFSSEIFAFFSGLIMGIIIDSVSSTGFGFNSVVLPIMCLSVSLLVQYLFNNNIKSSAVLTAFFSFIYFAVRFLIFFPSVNTKDTLTYFIRTAFVSALLTAVFGVLVFLLQKRAFKDSNIKR